MMGHLNSFSASGGGGLNKNFPKIQMPGGLPGGDVEASIWLVHYDAIYVFQWHHRLDAFMEKKSRFELIKIVDLEVRK